MARIIVNNPRQVINGGAKKYYFKVKGLGGPKGDQGVKGDTGSRGPQGEPGNAATVYVGSTTTLPVGQDATVENVGTQYNAVLNFGIPQGPRGPQGIQGERGEPGQKGDPGPRGIQGEKGTNATVYVGTTTTTNPGTQARVYNSGTDSNAVLNFEIPRGEKGETGATGATGATGPAGQNFTPTIVDSLPASGNQSNLYLTPKNYTTGTATGNPITISLGEEAGQITSAQLDGNTSQATYAGKNLLNLDPKSDGGVSGAITNGSTITVTGTALVTDGRSVATLLTTLQAGTYTLTIDHAANHVINFTVNTSGGNVAFRLGAGETSVTKTLISSSTAGQVFWAITQGQTYDETFKLQLVAGSTPDYDFEPYVGGTASPNPEYPEAINTVTGTQTVSINGTNYPLDLGAIELCKLLTYQDYIYKSGDNWKVHKATDKHIFNGSEDFSLDDIYNDIAQFRWADSSVIKIPDMYAIYVIADNFRGVQYSQSWAVNNAITAVNGHNALRFMTSSASTVASFQTWLSTHNTKAYYVLATATDTTITDQTLIAQLEAVRNATLQASNTITNTATGTNLAGDLELGYYEYDPHNRYNKWLWLDINNNYEQLGS